MSSLYEISTTILNVIENGFSVTEDGVIFEEEDLNELNVEFDAKIEAIACYCKNLDAEAAALREEAKHLTDRAKSKSAKSERMKGYMATALTAAGRTKFESTKCKLGFRRSEQVNVYQLDALPDEYRKVTVSADKVAIKKAIKNEGVAIPGANLVEVQNFTVK